ncbi:hypothetical protein EJ03DRAFT_388640 [Teratosphaeria nubilosa]|uniref:WW domain-containing protein n=1 Tax=Teratosphaeria nubilosa TaxID=161662 RepID=A0A6G1LDB1_9PEZI|nr:hypothetical protein EJ03DRAFT_388640 [Teratosphaeria nubilosa]
MADFAPPPGPPPPQVPAGWKAVWNEQYKEWFYVNIHTKQSTWEKPTEPVYASGDAPPPGAPPGYDHGSTQPTGPEKPGFASNNPYGGSSMTDDEALARKLQEEENARSGNRGAADGYYGQSGAPAYGQQGSAYGQQSPYGQSASPMPPQEAQKKGLFSKFTSKLGGGSSSRPPQYGQQYPPQQQYGGYGGYPQQQPYGYPPQQQGYYPQQAQAQKNHGLGAGGGALLGAGAGLVGGALLMDAVEDHDQHEYDQGYQQGYDQGDDGGGDFGGGDF